LGFGLAIAFGGVVGVGILRLPGTLASALGDSRLIVLFWIVGGVYALLGAFAVAELAAMLPQAGGFYVYARRAFGNRIGFSIGWNDWINYSATLTYSSMTAATFSAALWPPAAAYPRTFAVAILAAFTCLHWVGLRMGSTLTSLISVSIGLMLLTVVVGCFVVTPVAASNALPVAGSAASLPLLSMAMLAAVVPALRAVLLSYDGWYAPIYLAEESTNPTRTLPRAIIGGTLLVVALFVIFNIALVHVLPMHVLAASELPAADAARLILPRGGAGLVTLIALLTVLSCINATLLMAPRILLAIGRDGLFTEKAAMVSAGGTPRVALVVTSVVSAALILCGTFQQTVALVAVLFMINYVAAYTALFVLRHREPATSRPYRALGYPATTGVVLLGAVLFLIAAVVEDRRSGLVAALLLAASVPVYAWVARRRPVYAEQPSLEATAPDSAQAASTEAPPVTAVPIAPTS
jgi:APA family basic amino acid/polyamine antiporter